MGIKNKKSAIDLELTFVKTEAPEEIIAVVLVTKAPGAAAPDQGLRVGDAYFTAAQVFGKYDRSFQSLAMLDMQGLKGKYVLIFRCFYHS